VSTGPSKRESVGAAASQTGLLTRHILVVDDDPLICQQLDQLFTQEGYRVTVAPTAEHALQFLQGEDIDLVVTDIRLPGLDGVELTKQIVERWGDVPVIIMTGYAEIDNAVQVLKIGASDYIVKPFSAGAIQESTRVALEKGGSFAEIRQLRRHLKEGNQFGKMLSQSPEMHHVFETIRMLAPTDATVVVEGETGTGKELVARTIHQLSPRRNGPFITINCGGLPETLFESELFGYERGTFTGADQARPGKIELAHGGTLFLDEIENMSLSMQAKLLLVLNDQSVQRLGSSRRTRIDMRVIAATNVPLKELLAQGKMRNDFYFRILVVPIRLLPLRRRLDDLPLLIQDFLRHHPLALRKRITSISPHALDHLRRYPWPGNIRELHNVLEKAVIITKSRVLNLRDLDTDLLNIDALADGSKRKVSTELSLYQWIREQEKDYLIQKLKIFQGRIDLTAKSCGVDVRTIHRKMQIYGLDKKVFGKARPKADMKLQRDH
jgi:two-component system nitrogen regulation response regulator NtrX